MLGPRFERLNRSWAKDLYMNILMKYPSFLMILQVKFLQMVPEKNLKKFHTSFSTCCTLRKPS